MSILSFLLGIISKIQKFFEQALEDVHSAIEKFGQEALAFGTLIDTALSSPVALTVESLFPPLATWSQAILSLFAIWLPKATNLVNQVAAITTPTTTPQEIITFCINELRSAEENIKSGFIHTVVADVLSVLTGKSFSNILAALESIFQVSQTAIVASAANLSGGVVTVTGSSTPDSGPTDTPTSGVPADANATAEPVQTSSPNAV